jgi:drug/metabolite transporter (DMT)-like permease
MKNPTLAADASLLLTALIWGTGFAASQYALDSGMPTTLILLFRFGIAAAALAVILNRKLKNLTPRDLKSGFVAGIILFLAFYSQTVGLMFTTPSNNAFITATNVIMVPFITWVVFRKKPKIKFFILAMTTFLGVVILSFSFETGLNFSRGDFFSLLCAFFFALHISYLDMASKKVDALVLTFLQMTVAAAFSLAAFFVMDKGSAGNTDFARGFLPVLYLGLFSTLLCFFIQTSAQKHTTSTKAAIFLSTESLFGALFSVLLRLEPFTFNMLIGGSVILFSIFASEIKLKKPSWQRS